MLGHSQLHFRDYKNADNLHIGVTNSSGIVYEYDSNGLSFQKTSNWKRCLAIKDFNKDKDFGSWSQYWDFTLDVVSGHEEQWARTRQVISSNFYYLFPNII